MAINKINGNILSDNLIRGSNLAIQTDLFYVDIINDRIGVNTSTTTHTLTVSGNAVVGNIELDTNTLSTTGNLILLPSGNIQVSNVNINNLAEPVANSDAATKSYVDSQAGNVYFNISDGANTEPVYNADTISIVGVANEIDVVVSSIDTITIGLPSNVVIGDSLTVTNSASIANITISTNTISSSGNIVLLPTGNVSLSNVNLTNVANPVSNTDVTTKEYVDSAVGNVISSLGNFVFSNTTITTSISPANITLEPTGNSTVIIDTNSGLVIPVGTSAERPLSPAIGTVRFNSELSRVEVYDGVEWDSVVSGVTNQVLYGDNSTLIFALDRSSTSAATLVALNGVIQLPGVAYTVTGNAITFSQAPTVSDVIDVRFL